MTRLYWASRSTTYNPAPFSTFRKVDFYTSTIRGCDIGHALLLYADRGGGPGLRIASMDYCERSGTSDAKPVASSILGPSPHMTV